MEGCCGHSKNLRLDIKISCCAKYCIYSVLSCGDLLLSMCKKQWLSSLSHDYSRLRYDLHHVHFILVHVPYSCLRSLPSIALHISTAHNFTCDQRTHITKKAAFSLALDLIDINRHFLENDYSDLLIFSVVSN